MVCRFCRGPDVKDKMAIFTCNQCTTRSMKVFSRESFERGIVLVTCPQCQARHLLADRLGWFGEPGSVDDFLADHGQGGLAFSLSTGSLLGGVGRMGWGSACAKQALAEPGQGALPLLCLCAGPYMLSTLRILLVA